MGLKWKLDIIDILFNPEKCLKCGNEVKNHHKYTRHPVYNNICSECRREENHQNHDHEGLPGVRIHGLEKYLNELILKTFNINNTKYYVILKDNKLMITPERYNTITGDDETVTIREFIQSIYEKKGKYIIDTLNLVFCDKYFFKSIFDKILEKCDGVSKELQEIEPFYENFSNNLEELTKELK